MVDSSWENQAPAPSSGGGPAWVRWLLGCGLVAVIGIAALVVGGVTVANRKLNDPEVKAEMGKALQPLVRDLVEELRTDAGARELYSSHRGLRERYPSEAAFLAQIQAIRPFLPPKDAADLPFESRVSFQGMALDLRLTDGRHLLLVVKGRGKRHLPLRDLEVR